MCWICIGFKDLLGYVCLYVSVSAFVRYILIFIQDVTIMFTVNIRPVVIIFRFIVCSEYAFAYRVLSNKILQFLSSVY